MALVERNLKKRLIKNQTSLYKQVFKDRGVKHILHYGTEALRYPTAAEVASLTLVPVTWKVGDRYYKLANEFYGDSKLWWVIALFNKKPTEAHLNLGDVVQVPTPLEQILEYYRY